VLIVLTDVSKTGLVVPSPAESLALMRSAPGDVFVLVDACQFRMTPATLRAYLENGFMVALTGSKFLTGPAFSGALLIPDAVARRLRGCPLPAGLRAYSAKGEWPAGWSARETLAEAANYGLLMRWEAALVELRAFRGLDEGRIAPFAGRFAGAVKARIETDPSLAPLETPPPDRGRFGEAGSWDRIQTIHPFHIRHAEGRGGKPFSRGETAEVYRLLAADGAAAPGPRAQLGQPVSCGNREGVPVSALRLCLSARLIVEALTNGEAGTEAVIDRAIAVIDRTSAIARALSG
jgi:hypothetical protein